MKSYTSTAKILRWDGVHFYPKVGIWWGLIGHMNKFVRSDLLIKPREFNPRLKYHANPESPCSNSVYPYGMVLITSSYIVHQSVQKPSHYLKCHVIQIGVAQMRGLFTSINAVLTLTPAILSSGSVSKTHFLITTWAVIKTKNMITFWKFTNQ